MGGWIKMHRKLKKHWLFQEKRVYSKLEAWIDLLLRASYQDEKKMFNNKIVPLKRGQLVTSIRCLANDWDWSKKKVQSYLQLLVDDGMITVTSDKDKTIIEINQYDCYQGDAEETLKPAPSVESPELGGQGGDANGYAKGDTQNLEAEGVSSMEETPTGTQTGTNNKEIKNKKIKEPTSQEKTGKKNLSNDTEVEAFVESQMASNPFDKVPKKLIIKYINAIRFRRKTKRIAASIIAGLWEEWKKFDQDVVTYALWIHIEKYSKDKDENYTLGIMRNTDIHEARRQLMILKNRNQSGQQTKPRPYWEEQKRREEEIERKRLEQRDRQIKVQQFIDAGFHPMNDADLLADWLEGRVSLADLKERKWGS